MTHDIRLIRNDGDHAEALAAIENLWQAEPGTPEHSTSRFWRCWWTATRAGRWTIEPADPVEPIWHVMDQRGLTREDLETALGLRARVSYPESPLLNRRRPLTMKKAWRLHHTFGIPADALIWPYNLAR